MAAPCTGDNQSPDVDRVLSLYDHFDPAKLIAFAMGDAGKHPEYNAWPKALHLPMLR